jgi:DNA-binding transcriptional LysR family regulator
MKCFLSLAKTQKMSETAAAFGLSLSTLSKYIDKMEDELSAPLFLKKLSRQMLTREGELIYPSIEYIVKQYDDQRAENYKYTSRYESSINVAFGFQQAHIMRHLTAFIKECPRAQLNVTEGSASEVCAMLDSGAADVGIVYEQIVGKKYPLTFSLSNDKLCAIISKNHPLADRETVSLSQLQKETFFLYKGDHLMYRYLLNVCITAGFVPNVEQSTLRVSTILLNVAAGNGVSLLSEKTVANLQSITGNVALQLSENPLLTLCAICATEYPNKSIERLMEFLLRDVRVPS